jgi:hypothetical protein
MRRVLHLYFLHIGILLDFGIPDPCVLLDFGVLNLCVLNLSGYRSHVSVIGMWNLVLGHQDGLRSLTNQMRYSLKNQHQSRNLIYSMLEVLSPAKMACMIHQCCDLRKSLNNREQTCPHSLCQQLRKTLWMSLRSKHMTLLENQSGPFPLKVRSDCRDQ